jgi:hypothetical protein
MVKTLKQARAAFSMLKPDEVRKRSARPVHLGLVATSPSTYAAMVDFLDPAGTARGQVHRADDPTVPPNVDLVIYEAGLSIPEGAYSFDPENPESMVSVILDDQSGFDLPLARQFPAFRATVVENIIKEVARENAFFAIATALPNAVPNLIELPWALGEFASDTAFLTANQIRMAFLIAAACGHESGLKEQKGTILSIAAGAFGWRALARELTGKIPLGGGLIPKGAIAYAGTYVAGKSLELFYHGNRGATRGEREAMYQQAYAHGRSVAEGWAKAR